MLVTIIIPTHKGLNYIKKCSLRSVLNQTYKNLEIIIINDGFDKELKDFINNLEDDRIVYTEFEKKKYTTEYEAWCVGGACNRNFGLKIATGDLIAPLDQDDIWEDTFVEKKVNFFKNNENIDFVYSKCYVGLSRSERKLGEPITQKIKEGYLRRNLINVIPHLTVMYRSKLKVMLYPERGALAGDYSLWLDMIKKEVPMFFLDYADAINTLKTDNLDNVSQAYFNIFEKEIIKEL